MAAAFRCRVGRSSESYRDGCRTQDETGLGLSFALSRAIDRASSDGSGKPQPITLLQMVPLESTAADDARHVPLLLVPGADTRDLCAGPAETFVLACVDGQSSQVEIAQTTGLRLEEVASIVDSLVARGVVAFAAPHSSRQAARGPVSPTMQSGAYSLLGGPGQSLDLSAAQQHQLLDLDRRLGSLDHYELLGVGASADDKGIRAAYYQLVRTFHPDRFFGKQLGSFESKLLRVFAKITEAYDVLH